MHHHLAGDRVMPSDRDVLGRKRDDLTANADLAVIVRHHRHRVARLAAVRVMGIGELGGCRRRARGLRLRKRVERGFRGGVHARGGNPLLVDHGRVEDDGAALFGVEPIGRPDGAALRL